MTRQRVSLVTAGAMASLVLGGCATLVHGPYQDVRIDSTPPGATATVSPLLCERGPNFLDEKKKQTVTTPATVRLRRDNAYRVEVSVPTKQSLVSRNNRVYIRNVLVDSTGFDGKTTHQEIPVNAWVSPGDANGTALPEIGKSVKATVELGVESGEKHAVADVALLQAKLADDAASPHFPAVQRLLRIREVLAQKDLNRGLLKTTVDEALLSVPGELEKRATEQAAAVERRKQAKGTIAAGDATPDVVAALQEVSRLLGGTLQDQTDARAKLQALIESLQARP